jgi:Flp pilus assembly protein TadD
MYRPILGHLVNKDFMPPEESLPAAPTETPSIAGESRALAGVVTNPEEGAQTIWGKHKSRLLLLDYGWSGWSLGLLLVAAVCLVYSNTLQGAFQYDDGNDIWENLSIRHLWPIKDVFFIPDRGLMSRPVANLSFAINYATGGLAPFHYHLTNLGIHISAALALLGVIRRTLLLPRFRQQFAGQVATLSLVTAAWWALHPLLTESVSYITQRYESLMGLFVLLTFYCVLRMVASPMAVLWSLLASLSCLLALGSKEVAVSVPLLVLLFDRTFLVGSFGKALQEHRVLYLGLALSWACFAFLQLHAVERIFAGSSVSMPWWRYALNQPNVILHYLRLAVWPHPLNFDYFWPAAKNWIDLLPGLLAIGSLVGLTIWAYFLKPVLAFLLISFFCILAPTSSVMPILDLAVEHRMYLPLVFLIIIFVLLIHKIISSLSRFNLALVRTLAKVLIACLLAALGTMSYLRNEDYQNPIDLWRDVVEKTPKNPRGHHNYAICLVDAGYLEEGLRQFAISIELAPSSPLFLGNYAVNLGKAQRYDEALKYLRTAINLEPTNYKHIYNLGIIHWQKGSPENAMACFNESIKVNPAVGAPYAAAASLMLGKKEITKAEKLIRKAILLEPAEPRFEHQLGVVLLSRGDVNQARHAFQTAIHLDGNSGNMNSESGWSFHESGMDQEAVTYLRQALHLKPDHAKSAVRLAWILATSREDNLRNGKEAVDLARNLIASRPTPTPDLLDLLALALAEEGRFMEARAALEVALSGSRNRREAWVSNLEMHMSLFDQGLPYREPAR